MSSNKIKKVKNTSNKNSSDYEESFYLNEENIIPPSDIVSYNESKSCAEIYRLYKSGRFNIQPDYQRSEVWNKPQQTRFIDSLIKGLPIPSMCFSLDPKTQKWEVIDGLQRITSIIKFLDKKENWTLSDLDDVDNRIAGHTNLEIENNHIILYSTVENASIPITVLRCDLDKKAHRKFIYTIFHRLNTGGTKLNNQEIRNCIFAGAFNAMLKRCNDDTNWSKLLNRDDEEILTRSKKAIGAADKNSAAPSGVIKMNRFLDEELILRCFAFLENNIDKYDGKLSVFLNDYMEEKLSADEADCLKYEKLFKQSTDIYFNKILDGKIDKKISKVLLEVALASIMKNIIILKKDSPAKLNNKYTRLLDDENMTVENLSESVYAVAKVKRRIKTGLSIFKS